MTELKRCPFCGGEAELAIVKLWNHVHCRNCHARTTLYSSEEQAIEAWNTRVNPWHTGTPTEKEWVLGIFREGGTGWINPIPFVCEYLGVKTKATTKEGWIIKDCTDIDHPCDYYKNLQIVAWQKIEPYEASTESTEERE